MQNTMINNSLLILVVILIKIIDISITDNVLRYIVQSES